MRPAKILEQRKKICTCPYWDEEVEHELDNKIYNAFAERIDDFEIMATFILECLSE